MTHSNTRVRYYEASRVEDAPTATLAQDATAFTLGAAAPDAVVDVVLERVLEALTRYRTRGTDSLRDDHARRHLVGKNVPAGYSRHFPSAIHSVLMLTPFCTSLSHSSDCLRDEPITKGSIVHKPLVTILLTDVCKPSQRHGP